MVHYLWQNGVVTLNAVFQSNVILKLQVILESEIQNTKPVTSELAARYN